jgi:lambda family phage portal protein
MANRSAKRSAPKKKQPAPKKKNSRKTLQNVGKKSAKTPKKRRYEGASKSKRLSGWKTDGSSANSETAQSLPELRNRSRDLRRNNPYAARGIQTITSNVVGTGIVTQFREGKADILEKDWAQWAETTAIDFDGRNNIYGLQALVMDAVVESGEVLLRRRVLAALRYPFQYQVLEPDFLDTSKNETDVDGGGFIIQGIEFTAQGKRAAYWLFESHPGGQDAGFMRGTLKSNRVLVNELHHIFRMDRPGQARGVPWLSPIIVRLKDFDDMEDAQLMRQKIAACFTAFVRDISHEFYPELADADNDAYSDDAEHAEEAAAEFADRITPAMIEFLPKGKMVEFADPPSVENYGEYSSTVLHGMAAGLGITYEAFTGDYSQVNFSSGRMGRLEMNRNVRSWQERIIFLQMLDPIVSDFKLMLDIEGKNSNGVIAVHIAPPVEMIDPTKEVPMMIEEIRAGLDTLSNKLLARGFDPAKLLAAYKKDADLLDKLGLKLTTDPRVELSQKGKNTIKGEIGNENEKNPAPKRTMPRGLRAGVVRSKKSDNGRGMVNRRAS